MEPQASNLDLFEELVGRAKAVREDLDRQIEDLDERKRLLVAERVRMERVVRIASPGEVEKNGKGPKKGQAKGRTPALAVVPRVKEERLVETLAEIRRAAAEGAEITAPEIAKRVGLSKEMMNKRFVALRARGDLQLVGRTGGKGGGRLVFALPDRHEEVSRLAGANAR